MRKYLISAAALIAVAGGTVVIAQAPMAVPGSKDVAKVTGGTYSVEPSHTQIVFAYDHMGFTNNMGVITQPTGTLTLDKANLSASKVSITLPNKTLVNLGEHEHKHKQGNCWMREHKHKQ